MLSLRQHSEDTTECLKNWIIGRAEVYTLSRYVETRSMLMSNHFSRFGEMILLIIQHQASTRL